MHLLGLMQDSGNKTPKQLGFRMPAEWERHEAIWMAWPHDVNTWKDPLEIEDTCVEIVWALHAGEKIKLLVNDEEEERRAKEKLKNAKIGLNQVIFCRIPNVDAWMRDCSPIFLVNDKTKEKRYVHWEFNAWGNKYDDLLEDRAIPKKLSEFLKLKSFRPGIVLEGGSIDVNGTGTVLTSEQCLLNKNRNPSLTKERIEQYLKDYLNVSNVLWLREGIAGDDTDGHIDDIARFVGQNTVVCAFEDDENDENYPILKENYNLLLEMKDENGKNLNVIRLPMPGFVGDKEGRLPASYLNFYIGNSAVAVPVFGHENDKKALEILQKQFPSRKVVGINCTAMVYGLGTIHCRSQQEPQI